MIKKIWSLICICYLITTACNKPDNSFLPKKEHSDKLENYLKEVHNIDINSNFNSPVFIFYPNNCGSCSDQLQQFITEITPQLKKPYALIVSDKKKNTEFINGSDFKLLVDTTDNIYNYGIVNVFDMIYVFKSGKVDLKKELKEENYNEIKKYLTQ